MHSSEISLQSKAKHNSRNNLIQTLDKDKLKLKNSSKKVNRVDTDFLKPPTGLNPSKHFSLINTQPNSIPDRRCSENLDYYHDVNHLLEEGKEREERLKKRLEFLKKHTKLVLNKHNTETKNNDSDNKKLSDRLVQCQGELNNFRESMDNILKISKKTHCDLKKTKDIVSNLDVSQNRICHSFQAGGVEYDEIYTLRNTILRSEQEYPRTLKESPMITINDEDRISKFY